MALLTFQMLRRLSTERSPGWIKWRVFHTPGCPERDSHPAYGDTGLDIRHDWRMKIRTADSGDLDVVLDLRLALGTDASRAA